MTVDLTNPMFHNESAARAQFEGIRWTSGPFCAQYGAVAGNTRLEGKSHRAGSSPVSI
jgi:hypothetical protein